MSGEIIGKENGRWEKEPDKGMFMFFQIVLDSYASTRRKQTSLEQFSLVNLACGKFTVWFHLSLIGVSELITRPNCELLSSPQQSPCPFQMGSG
jgi:hypothetical protein